jgi:GDPmannose 4,6-dehydratase/GDP-4-dehydro-6-deoxy-D-mannose reductase
MKVLITGITGMVGSHLAEYLLSSFPEMEVHGLVRWRSPLRNIQKILPRIRLHQGDLRDLNSLVVLLREVRPDRIHHLAAQSYVDMSFTAPADTLNSNIIGTVNLMDAVRIVGINPRIHICSSSEVYGQVLPDEVPITEATPLRPASPYAVSKVGEDMIAFQYGISYKLDLVRTRMFTHTGPRRGDVFAESSFARQIAEIELNRQKGPVRVGNLNSVRTLADVRDAVRAYKLLLDTCPAGEVYNIGGKETMTIGDILETLKSLARVPIEHVVDPARLRPSDVTLQIPDTSKFQGVTGWQPQIPASQTLRDLLDYQRDCVRAEEA